MHGNVESLNRLLGAVMASTPGISDINFTVGRPPQVEVHGQLGPVPLEPSPAVLTAHDTEAMAHALLAGHDDLRRTLAETGSCDCAHALTDGTRFRVNLFHARGHISVVLRALASTVPDLETLCLPEAIHRIPELTNGLVLVTGSTGSGKSTTLAAVVDRINASRSVHIVTLEDPIEYLHPHRKGTVNQRELGTDFRAFADGLRAALRQAPKVILVGEMRDRETVEIALKAAETGHLVMSTLHTVDAGQTINRITGMFEMAERRLVRSRLADVLRWVVGQRLLPREEGGRVPAMEIMTSTLRVRDLILNGEDGDRTFYNVIEDGAAHGMQTFDQHILLLYEDAIISEATGKAYCSDVSTVGREIDRIRVKRGENTSDLGDLEMAEDPRELRRKRRTREVASGPVRETR
jgi:twitching motility protein PilT